jgi:hypothetical protein
MFKHCRNGKSFPIAMAIAMVVLFALVAMVFTQISVAAQQIPQDVDYQNPSYGINVPPAPFTPEASSHPVQDAIEENKAYPGNQFYLVQLSVYNLDAAEKERMLSEGMKIFDYIENNTYIMKIPDLTKMDESIVRWIGVFKPEYKYRPDLEKIKDNKSVALGTDAQFIIQFFEPLTKDQKAELQDVLRFTIVSFRDSDNSAIINAEPDYLKLVASVVFVRRIELQGGGAPTVKQNSSTSTFPPGVYELDCPIFHYSKEFEITPYEFDEVVKRGIEKGYSVEMLVKENTHIYINTLNQTTYRFYSKKQMGANNFSKTISFANHIEKSFIIVSGNYIEQHNSMETELFNYYLGFHNDTGYIHITQYAWPVDMEAVKAEAISEMHAFGIREAGTIEFGAPTAEHCYGVMLTTTDGSHSGNRSVISSTFVLLLPYITAIVIIAAVAATFFIVLKIKRRKYEDIFTGSSHINSRCVHFRFSSFRTSRSPSIRFSW